jgi:hypothetical protein
MTTRTFIDKNGNEWSWEETPEVLKALKELHDETQTNTETTTVG